MKYLAIILLTLLPSIGLCTQFPSTPKIAHVTGVIDDQSAVAFMAELEATATIDGDQFVLIDSPGGVVSSGNAMIEALEAEKASGTKVTCIVTGMAASMAFNILSHCDVRIADTHAMLLFHKVAIGEMPNIRLTGPNLRAIAALLDKVDAPFVLYNRTALGMDEDEYNFYADKDAWWSATMLKRLGYLNSVGNFHEPDSK